MTAPAIMHNGKTIAKTFVRAADGINAMISNKNAHSATSNSAKMLINTFP